MKLHRRTLATHYAASPTDAEALLRYLESRGLKASADRNVRPCVTVAGVSQVDLNEICWEWERALFEARRARELREGQSQ